MDSTAIPDSRIKRIPALLSSPLLLFLQHVAFYLKLLLFRNNKDETIAISMFTIKTNYIQNF
ncbi:hypothetical protein M493_09745 [Geobacillus genomosp. 3]|uniref:Uncharacterized protein n=1 Tax=Geobacillus genomosp. 3 TaxID=1921421 RepID=S5ZDA8_GEOG3|nr:hypothetical protein M493_09745 [Geobacillus genomosp. 3]